MTISQKLSENFLSVVDFVEYVGVISYSGAYKKIQKGIIPSITINNKIYIPKSWVKETYEDVLEAALSSRIKGEE